MARFLLGPRLTRVDPHSPAGLSLTRPQSDDNDDEPSFGYSLPIRLLAAINSSAFNSLSPVPCCTMT